MQFGELTMNIESVSQILSPDMNVLLIRLNNFQINIRRKYVS